MSRERLKIQIQKFGRSLSNMVMPNIGAFIAWGLITAIFIPDGWLPNASLAKLVTPMITYLLPLLIGHTGGRLVAGDRGGVVGAIATIGVIVGSEIPMFLGAMLMGPLGGYAIEKLDQYLKPYTPAGFEMLINNFSAGILGAILALLSFSAIGPCVMIFSTTLASGVKFLVNHQLLPFTSILVEPAKVFFLNNAINHGIFSPLGIQQSTEIGFSPFFLLEANPGPGLGLLLAYRQFGKGEAKSTAVGASIIHFIGGIHEIYFPYILMNLKLLLAVIAGGMVGNFVLITLKSGLIAAASPGSIVAVLMMTPKGCMLGVLLAIIAAALTSFAVAMPILLSSHETGTTNLPSKPDTGTSSQPTPSNGTHPIRSIAVACDAGMGSSAMGAKFLKKKLDEAGLTHISVEHYAINALPEEVDLIITHEDLTPRAKLARPHCQHRSLTQFLDAKFYDQLIADLLQNASPPSANRTAPTGELAKTPLPLSKEQIFLQCQSCSKTEAISRAGKALVATGAVTESYVDAMHEREKLASTYLGEGIAMPHGTDTAKEAIKKAGLVIFQYPEGVLFTDDPTEKAYLVIAIAAPAQEHIPLLAQITTLLDDPTRLQRLKTCVDVTEFLALLTTTH